MSDDFFSNVPARRPAHSPPPATPDTHDDFAHAISLRFGSADLRTARLLPGDLPPQGDHPPTHTLAHSNPPPPPPPAPLESFSSTTPSALAPYFADPRALILDIRPHAAHAAARVKHALSLSVPTTLLKRPLFSLSKLSQMLPSPSSRARFADWSSASCILVYDSDSVSSPDNSIIAGLLRKFRAEGFSGELGWVRGGFQAVWREARDLTTTEQPIHEEDDPDTASSSGTLRTTHLPKAAFSLISTTTVPQPQSGVVSTSLPPPNTPAPSASRAANPFFDAIRQNVELSHGITERIPLRLPRRVRRRIHDLPFRWLQDIARRSALRHMSASRHLGLDSFESGSESSDDPHTSDPDENDPNVEEGTEALAMQFYRIELAEQRRLRSIMEHHTRESEVSALTSSTKPRRALDKSGTVVTADRGAAARTSSKSMPGTPHQTPFPFSITAGVEKGTKNRYNHIWPFEHARVRLHDGRHQGSHLSRRDKGKSSERGRSTKDRTGGENKEWDEQGPEEKQRRSRSSPTINRHQEAEERSGATRHSFSFESQSSVARAQMGFEAGLSYPISSPSSGVPRVKIEYDVGDQDTLMSETPTPATALPLLTPPFYTPMEIPSALTPMRQWPLQHLSLSSGLMSPGGRSGGTQFALSASGLPSPALLPSLSLRLPNRPGGLLPSIEEQAWTSESLPSSVAPFGMFSVRAVGGAGTVSETRVGRDLRRELSPGDDYVNASYVQPLGTRKRYIATQGPLPSTYVDFWTLVWEQNVHVIVMLTREVENAMVKCGSYWTDTEYGPLRLELVSSSPPMSPNAHLTTMDNSKQGFFAIREPREKHGTSRDQPTLITRTFTLSHTSYPGVPPRKITHLQYLDWSDMNVPEDPRGVLDLIRKVEWAAAESTPGPSPSGSFSPRSGSGSLSGSPSPDVIPDNKGCDTSLLSPTSAMLGGRRRRCGSEWRHPELDSKTGVAAFALGKVAPVLLHCSAGVGRTGGFIAVDAVLDGIKRELRKNMEQRRLKKFGVVESGCRACADDIQVNVGLGTQDPGVDGAFDNSGHMDVDEMATGVAENIREIPYMVNTVPIQVSAGEYPKDGRRHHQTRDPSGKKQSHNSEPLVVHVPCVGSAVPETTNNSGIGLAAIKESGWQPHSTREWVEQVSDQTRTHTDDGELPPSSSHLHSSREGSPESTSNSSDSSALNSSDDSMNGSANASGSGSGVGNTSGRKSDTGSGSGSGSGSGGPLPSSLSKPGSGSISLSATGSGTGTGSRVGSSLLHTALRDSSVTSISVKSAHSHSFEHESKASASHHQLLAMHTGSSSDMDVDHPSRPVSVPVQLVHPSTVGLQRAVHLRHYKATLGSSPTASISTPILLSRIAQGDAPFVGDNSAGGSASQPSSNINSAELASPPQVPESKEITDSQGTRRSNRVELEGRTALAKPGNNLRLNTELGSLKVPEMLRSSGSRLHVPLPAAETTGQEIATMPTVGRTVEDSAMRKSPTSLVGINLFQHEPSADHQVIDYKLPRELHTDLSPPLISSLAEPIFMVIQDMREQRMSLCQSLRQYVFVHAAVIEGALRVVDEEHELWGYSGTSDDASSVEGELEREVREGGRRSSREAGMRTWFGMARRAVTTPEFEHGGLSPGTNSLKKTAQPSNQRASEGSVRGAQNQVTSASPSSGMSSPSKGKRGPSPTELLREDKTGALSSNKRPSIHRKRRSNQGDPFSLDSNKASPVASESGGGSSDPAVDVGGIRVAPGRPGASEKGGPTSGPN